MAVECPVMARLVRHALNRGNVLEGPLRDRIADGGNPGCQGQVSTHSGLSPPLDSNAGPCPKADPRPEWPPSNSLRAAPFDNTERRLDGRERYVVGHNRLGEALEGERAKLFSCDASL